MKIRSMLSALALSVLPVAAVAAISALLTDANGAWYLSLRKPAFTPPDWAFPLAWGVVYVCAMASIYLLLRDSLSANFLYTSWKRFRKYNAYATGITQNVQDCLTNDTAYAMLANSEFVVMLRQTKDIDSVVELYGLSEPQRKYLLLAQPGEGIIKMGNSLIPFNNPQPKDTKTYKLLTTKPGEMEG